MVLLVCWQFLPRRLAYPVCIQNIGAFLLHLILMTTSQTSGTEVMFVLVPTNFFHDSLFPPLITLHALALAALHAIKFICVEYFSYLSQVLIAPLEVGIYHGTPGSVGRGEVSRNFLFSCKRLKVPRLCIFSLTLFPCVFTRAIL